MTEDVVVEVAVVQAKLYLRDGYERHRVALSNLINDADDPENVAAKVARRLGRVRGSELFCPQIVEKGCRGRLR